jgi:hypothetical protein
MRLSNTVLGSAILAAVALSACTTPGQLSRSEENKRMIEAEFGQVGRKSNPEAFRQNGTDGAGFSMFRLFSEKPMPNRFGKMVPEKFDNTLVVDFGIEMQIKDRFPLYRIGMDPQKISQRRIDLWPSHVSVKASGPDGEARELAARLPEVRVPGADGMIWSDWTYCADCFDLEAIRDADVDTADESFAALNDAYRAAKSENGTPSMYDGQAQFTVTPGVGILIGEAAEEMAQKASDVVTASAARIAQMRPARDAYDALRLDFAQSGSPARELDRLCGTYEPNRDRVSLAEEKLRIEAYLDCGASTLRSYDTGERQKVVATFKSYESEMAEKAGLKDADRIVFPSTSAEMKAAEDVLGAARSRYISFAQALGASAASVTPTAKPVATAAVPAAAAEKVTDVVEQARVAIEKSPATPPKPAADKIAKEDPARDVYYVARLLPNGANMDIGQQKAGCVADMECETGSVVALIASTGYCEAEGDVTKTSSNWGMLVQRYLPQDREQEARIVAGDGTSKIHIVTDNDKTAMTEGLAALRGLTTDGDQVFFTSYQEFHKLNTQEKGCKDLWRDAAKNKVAHNPSESVSG